MLLPFIFLRALVIPLQCRGLLSFVYCAIGPMPVEYRGVRLIICELIASLCVWPRPKWRRIRLSGCNIKVCDDSLCLEVLYHSPGHCSSIKFGSALGYQLFYVSTILIVRNRWRHLIAVNDLWKKSVPSFWALRGAPCNIQEIRFVEHIRDTCRIPSTNRDLVVL